MSPFAKAGAAIAGLTLIGLLPCGVAARAQTAITNISYAEGQIVLDALRRDLWPVYLQVQPPAQLPSAWSEWVSRQDAHIRTRVRLGEEDSIVMFLLFGLTFTLEPRYSFAAWAAGNPPPGRIEDIVAKDAIVSARIDDLVAAVAMPGANERLQLVGQVMERRGIDVGDAAGRQQARQFLVAHLRRVLTDYDPMQFVDRGLSSDTSIYSSFAIDRSIADVASRRIFSAGGVRRVAIIGPGLDFTDKQEGYDFYPLQTIQPFAAIDSLHRAGLGNLEGFAVSIYDVNPRVQQHLARARQRARLGESYVVHLARDTAQPWDPRLAAYWAQFGDHIGKDVTPISPPARLAKVQVRAVSIRPDEVLSAIPQNVNIVLQRPEPLPAKDKFDLVIATNVLVYYGVFEQSLALVNIAAMLRSGGLLLSNNPLFELPGIPLRAIGRTVATYVDATGDQIYWYQRQ